MTFTKLIPNVFYTDIKVGLNLFVDCLGFENVYDTFGTNEAPFCILSKDNLTIHVHENEEYALKDRPELRMETDDINAVYASIKERHPELLHPNGKVVTLKPWNVYEFALLDASGVCVIIYQRP